MKVYKLSPDVLQTVLTIAREKAVYVAFDHFGQILYSTDRDALLKEKSAATILKICKD